MSDQIPPFSRASQSDPLTHNTNAVSRLLLGRKSSSFEQSLYNRGKDLRGAQNYYKYPLELMEDEAHMGAMVIEIYDTNPAALETKRNRVQFYNEDNAAAGKEAQEAAEKGEGARADVGDIIGAGVNALEGASNQFIQAIVGALGSGVLNPPKGVGNIPGEGRLARNSFTEEVTGVGGGTSKVNTRIYLYIPANIQADYGFQYEEKNMSGMDVLKLPKAMGQGDAAVANAIGKKLAMGNMKQLEKFTEKVGIEAGTVAKYVEASQRQIANPMALHLFKEVKRRSFTFAYVFLPKSREEMLNCHGIINRLKYYAHPATSGAGRFLDYPAEFDIKFFQKDKVNGYLPYIFKCALTGIKVTYGEESVMSMFLDDWDDPMGAAPTKIKMELTFDELEVLTRDRFDLAPNSINP